MNQRIQELEAQCWEERKYGPAWFDSEKFAELIVQECVESIPSDGHRGDFLRAVKFCQQQIKQHFGVEE